jgi:hypothetical protein
LCDSLDISPQATENSNSPESCPERLRLSTAYSVSPSFASGKGPRNRARKAILQDLGSLSLDSSISTISVASLVCMAEPNAVIESVDNMLNLKSYVVNSFFKPSELRADYVIVVSFLFPFAA